MFFFVLLSIGLAYQHQQAVYQEEKLKTLEELSKISQAKVGLFHKWLEDTKRDIRYLIAAPSIRGILEKTRPSEHQNFDSLTLDQFYNSLANSFSAYLLAKENVTQARLIGVDNNGLELVRVNKINTDALPVRREDLQQKGARDYFKAIAKLTQNEIYISDINLNRENGEVSLPIEPTLRMGIPIYQNDSSLFGELVLNFSMQNWLAIFSKTPTQNSRIQSYLMNTDGAYLAHPDKGKAFGFDLGEPLFFDDEFKVSSEAVIQRKVQANSFKTEEFFYAKQTIWLESNSKRNISLVLMQPRANALHHSIEAGLYRLAAFLLFGVSVGSLILYLSFRERIKQEKIKFEMTNQMDLLTRQIVNSSPVAQILVNTQGCIELVNDETLKLFGYEKSELLGQSIELLIPHDVRHIHISLREKYSVSAEKRRMGVGKELKALKKDQQMIPVEIGLSRIDTLDGVKILAAIIDISTHQKLLLDLSRRNSELHDFAYVASHDLKSPLRGIDQLASWLEEDLKGQIDPESVENLKLMRSRINRMELLLSDLLSYARAGNTSDSPELIDTSVLIQDIYDLHCVNSAFKLELIEPMPRFKTVKTPLEVVLRNLITNAIKHHDKDYGEITISASEKANFIEFKVEDDGPGIEKAHRERIFGLFQTLRPRDEVEGSGMGLAIVKKTIETFGGSIQLTDSDSHGTLFIFTWPIYEA